MNKGYEAKEIKNPLKILRATIKNGLEEVAKLWLDKGYNK